MTRTRTAWQYFQMDRTARVKLTPDIRDCGDFGIITRELGKLWKRMDTASRRPYQDQVERDKLQLAADKTEPDSPTVQEEDRANRTPYEMFLLESSPEIQTRHPDWDFTQILELLDSQWKNLQRTFQSLEKENQQLRESNRRLEESNRQLQQKNSETLQQQVVLEELISRAEAVQQSQATALILRQQLREKVLQQKIVSLTNTRPPPSNGTFIPWCVSVAIWTYSQMYNQGDYQKLSS